MAKNQIVETLHDFLNFLRHLGLCLKYNPKLLPPYLKIKFKSLSPVDFIRSEDILGYKIFFLKYRIFAAYFEEIFIQNQYFFKVFTKNPLIMDCGTYTGEEIVYFKNLYPKSRIIAFEPDPEAFNAAQKNIDQNGLSEVTLYNQALGPKFPLSPFIKQPVDFMKMDIEGAEDVVIRELDKSKKLKKIKEIVMEYHHHKDTGNDNLGEMLKTLERNGFGYQLTSPLKPPFVKKAFQDIIIYAYRK